MFDFLEEIAIKTGLPFDILTNGFKVINFNNKSIYIENFTNIIDFSSTEILIKLKKGVIKILGDNLKIKNMNLQSIIVSGDILSMEIA